MEVPKIYRTDNDTVQILNGKRNNRKTAIIHSNAERRPRKPTDTEEVEESSATEKPTKREVIYINSAMRGNWYGGKTHRGEGRVRCTSHKKQIKGRGKTNGTGNKGVRNEGKKEGTHRRRIMGKANGERYELGRWKE